MGLGRRKGDKQDQAHPVVILSEAPLPGQGISRNAQELGHLTETARLLGCRVVTLLAEGDTRGSAEDALAALVPFPYSPPVSGVWIGSIPSLAHYGAVYRAARARGIRLTNGPTQHQRVLEGDRALPALGVLTPETVIVTTVDQCAAAASKLGFPLFVKGVVKSRDDSPSLKGRGFYGLAPMLCRPTAIRLVSFNTAEVECAATA